ncbi:hypothetical protein F2Q68_00006744 [Brassica cretica]|uniref:Uncharacterized protein n=1 Tax=Brassica cretica TaxID=69181 RepID=A0A8S9JJ66_BRACR|nr:hypothetical protein F2Q68_00006744 [Brassica cretica]
MSNDKSRVISFDFRDECIPAKDTALTTNDQGTLGGDIECSGSKSVKPADKRSCSSLLSCFLVIKIYSFVQSTVALTLLTQSSRNLPLPSSSVHLQALLSDASTKTLNQSLFSSDLGFGTGFSHDLNLQFVNAKLCYHLVYEGLSLNQCSIHPCKLHSKLDSLFCWLSFKVILKKKKKNKRRKVNLKKKIDTLSSKMEALSILSKTIDLQDLSVQDTYTKKDCSRHCKAVMRKIADQVRAEAEQWSQMQDMLGQVRNEMEELQSCRDFWQNRALESDSQIQNLYSSVEGWRRKALSSEAKFKNIQAEVCGLQEEIKRLRKEGNKLEPEKNKLPTESEKRVLICRLKENRHSNNGAWSKHSEGRTAKPPCSRQPLREIKNGSVAVTRQRNTTMS